MAKYKERGTARKIQINIGIEVEAEAEPAPTPAHVHARGHGHSLVQNVGGSPCSAMWCVGVCACVCARTSSCCRHCACAGADAHVYRSSPVSYVLCVCVNIMMFVSRTICMRMYEPRTICFTQTKCALYHVSRVSSCVCVYHHVCVTNYIHACV